MRRGTGAAVWETNHARLRSANNDPAMSSIVAATTAQNQRENVATIQEATVKQTPAPRSDASAWCGSKCSIVA